MINPDIIVLMKSGKLLYKTRNLKSFIQFEFTAQWYSIQSYTRTCSHVLVHNYCTSNQFYLK